MRQISPYVEAAARRAGVVIPPRRDTLVDLTPDYFDRAPIANPDRPYPAEADREPRDGDKIWVLVTACAISAAVIGWIIWRIVAGVGALIP